MFRDVIERWVALAVFSDNLEIRNGTHTRGSDWPEILVHAEKDRARFDKNISWVVACTLNNNQQRVLAFAMATHPRLGARSPALDLVADVVRHVSRSYLLPCTDVIYRTFLHEISTPSVMSSSSSSQEMILYGVPVLTEYRDLTALIMRRLLKSELENQPMFVWTGRTGIVFCRRGWFAGVDKCYAPPEHDDDDVENPGRVLIGIFESVPHVFCDIWFPICRPFSICLHLVHVFFRLK